MTVRIDDSDAARSSQKYVDGLLDTLKWLGLDYDDIIRQSERTHIYNEHLDALRSAGRTRLSSSVLELKPAPSPIVWRDTIAGDITIDVKKISTDRMILVRKDNKVACDFSAAIDEIELGINYAVRNIDRISDIALKAMLYSFFDKKLPTYSHIGLIHHDKTILSSRDGVSNMRFYRDSYDPDAVLDFMVRLGWEPKIDSKTLLPRDRMLEMFLEHGNLKSCPYNLDFVKLNSLNRKYLALKEKLA